MNSFPNLQAILRNAFWNSHMEVFRPSVSKVSAVQRVRGLSKVDCHHRATSNFDRKGSFAGQSNQDNQDTSDEVDFGIDEDVRAADVILIDGKHWFKIAGDPQEKYLLPQRTAFVTTTTPPNVIDGYWGE